MGSWIISTSVLDVANKLILLVHFSLMLMKWFSTFNWKQSTKKKLLLNWCLIQCNIAIKVTNVLKLTVNLWPPQLLVLIEWHRYNKEEQFWYIKELICKTYPCLTAHKLPKQCKCIFLLWNILKHLRFNYHWSCYQQNKQPKPAFLNSKMT